MRIRVCSASKTNTLIVVIIVLIILYNYNKASTYNIQHTNDKYKMLKSGHKVVPLSGDEEEQQKKDFKAYSVGLIRLQPGGWFFTAPFAEYADKVYDFKFKPTDLLIMSYPKSGTTWTQEIVWTMVHNANLKNPLAKMKMFLRSSHIDGDFLLKHPGIPEEIKKNIYEGMMLDIAESQTEPRVLKTHLSFDLLSPQLLNTCKIIYVARNPKDVINSCYHHSKLQKIRDYVGTYDQFVEHFINDRMLFNPYWPHIEDAWQKRTHPNMHFIFYEDIKSNPKAEIIKLQDYLGTKLTDLQLENIVQHTKFQEMQARGKEFEKEYMQIMNEQVHKTEGGFFRKGEAGDYRNKMSEEMTTKVDQWTNRNVAKFEAGYKYA